MKTSKITRTMPFALGLSVGLCMALGALLYVDRAEAQTRNLGPFMIMHHANTTASPGVFRVNQSTGYVSYCYVNSSSQPAVSCTPEAP
jgi:hypothetical protein